MAERARLDMSGFIFIFSEKGVIWTADTAKLHGNWF